MGPLILCVEGFPFPPPTRPLATWRGEGTQLSGDGSGLCVLGDGAKVYKSTLISVDGSGDGLRMGGRRAGLQVNFDIARRLRGRVAYGVMEGRFASEL